MTAYPPRIARCANVVEYPDLTAAPCAGLLHFAPGDPQAQCDTCGAWCGAGVTDYLNDLRTQLLAVITDKRHRAIVFRDLGQVPVGSVGYFSPSERDALRTKHGCCHEGQR